MSQKNIKSTIVSLVVILSVVSVVVIAITYAVVEGSKREKGAILKSMGSGQKFTGFNKMLAKKKKLENRKKALKGNR